jgi:hypothetical protein
MLLEGKARKRLQDEVTLMTVCVCVCVCVCVFVCVLCVCVHLFHLSQAFIGLFVDGARNDTCGGSNDCVRFVPPNVSL